MTTCMRPPWRLRRGPIPALTQPLAPDELTAALRAFSGSYYASHPFHSLMHEGRLTPRQLQGWVAESARVSAGDSAEGRGDHFELSRFRRPARVAAADHRSRRDRTGHGRHRDVDQARRGARRATRRDGGRAARAAGRAVCLRSVRHVLQDEAVDRQRGVVADRALCAGSDAAAHRRVSGALRGSAPRRSTTSRAV